MQIIYFLTATGYGLAAITQNCASGTPSPCLIVCLLGGASVNCFWLFMPLFAIMNSYEASQIGKTGVMLFVHCQHDCSEIPLPSSNYFRPSWFREGLDKEELNILLVVEGICWIYFVIKGLRDQLCQSYWFALRTAIKICLLGTSPDYALLNLCTSIKIINK